jgi:hypothetical protein
MSNDINNANPVDAARSAVIDAMVAAGTTDEHAQITQGESLRYDSQTGEVTGTPVVNRIPDDGRDIPTETAAVRARVNALQARLAEKAFDPKTGEETYVVADPAQREQLTAQFHRALETAELDILSLTRLAAQREHDRVTTEASANERLAIQAYSNGDPARAAVLKEALAKVEAEEVARAIVEGRRVASKHGAR